MKEQQFIEYIKELQKIERAQTNLIGTGVSLIDYNENFFMAMDYLMKALFEPYQIDLINDYVWGKKEIKIYKKDSKKVIFVIKSPETLWDYFETNKKK